MSIDFYELIRVKANLKKTVWTFDIVHSLLLIISYLWLIFSINMVINTI